MKLKILKVYASIKYPKINLPWAHQDLKHLYVAACCLQLSLRKLMRHFIQVQLLSTLLWPNYGVFYLSVFQ